MFQDHEERKKGGATPVGSENLTAQLLIPESACSLVRANLEKMQQDSNATIKVTPAENQPQGTQVNSRSQGDFRSKVDSPHQSCQLKSTPCTQERIVTVSGNIQQVPTPETLQGYLARKKTPPPLRTTIGPWV